MLYFQHTPTTLVTCTDFGIFQRPDHGFVITVALHNDAGPVSAGLTMWYADPCVTFFNQSNARMLYTDAGIGDGNGTPTTNPRQVPANGSTTFSIGWSPPTNLDRQAAILAQAPGSTTWYPGDPLNAQYDLRFASNIVFLLEPVEVRPYLMPGQPAAAARSGLLETIDLAFGLVNPDEEQRDSSVSVTFLEEDDLRELGEVAGIKRLRENGYQIAAPRAHRLELGIERVVPGPGHPSGGARIYNRGIISAERFVQLLERREPREVQRDGRLHVPLAGNETRQALLKVSPAPSANRFYVARVTHTIQSGEPQAGGVLFVLVG